MPNIGICNHSRPLLIGGLIELLRGYTVYTCGGESGAVPNAASIPEVDLVLVYGLSTHNPKLHARCAFTGVKPALFLSDGWLETDDAVRGAGYQGYLGPGSNAQQLFEALQAVLDGGFYYHPGNGLERPVGHLTPRQVAVMRAIGLGRSDQEVAKELGISEPTVRYHLEKLFEKLRVERRGEIIALAALGGLLMEDKSGSDGI